MQVTNTGASLWWAWWADRQNEISMELFIGPLNDLTGNITKLIEDFEK